MVSQAASALLVFGVVLALETWVTVMMPPKATSVATAATIRRLPLSQDGHLDSRR
jgi:hypothetical protein